MALGVGLVEWGGGFQRLPIDAGDAVARLQTGSFRGASGYHVANSYGMRLLIIVVAVHPVEAQLYRWSQSALFVHPQGAVERRKRGKQRRQGGKKRFGEGRASAHDSRDSHYMSSERMLSRLSECRQERVRREPQTNKFEAAGPISYNLSLTTDRGERSYGWRK